MAISVPALLHLPLIKTVSLSYFSWKYLVILYAASALPPFVTSSSNAFGRDTWAYIVSMQARSLGVSIVPLKKTRQRQFLPPLHEPFHGVLPVLGMGAS